MSRLKNPTLRRRTKELSECAEDARECQLLGYELKDLGSLLVKMAFHMGDLQRKVDSQAEYIKTLNEERKTEPNSKVSEIPTGSEKPNDCKWSVEYAKEMLNTMSCEECGHWEHGAGNHYYCALLEMGQECFFESKDESTLMFANEPKTEPQTCATCEQLGRCDRGRAVDCPITEPQTERSEWMNDLEIMKSYCNKCKHKGTCISICPTVWFAVLQKEHKEGSSK